MTVIDITRFLRQKAESDAYNAINECSYCLKLRFTARYHFEDGWVDMCLYCLHDGLDRIRQAEEEFGYD
jgi:hypothetical protein